MIRPILILAPRTRAVLVRACRVAFIIACVVFAAPALAQEKAEDYIEPRVDRTQFQRFLQAVDLPKDMRDIANLLFTDYTSALAELATTLDAQANTAGRKTVADALAGKARVAPEELKRLRLEVMKIYQRAGPKADAALRNLLEGVESLITHEQQPAFKSAVRDLRRRILLHPRQTESEFQEYAGDGVDVLLLAEQAAAEGAELSGLDPAALGPILDSYEVLLDALLIQSAAAHRDGRVLRKMASVEKDAAALKQHEQAAIARWKQLYELNQATVRQIAAAAQATLGEDASQRWLNRFDQASFTWLYPRRKPDRQIEWLRQQAGGMAADTMEKAEEIYGQFVQRRMMLSRKAIDLMLRARMEFQTMLYSMMDPTGIEDRVGRGLYEELLKNTGEQANLESTTSSSLEALLNDQQREKMRDAMKRPDPARRR